MKKEGFVAAEAKERKAGVGRIEEVSNAELYKMRNEATDSVCDSYEHRRIG